jgi:hypothetical protein
MPVILRCDGAQKLSRLLDIGDVRLHFFDHPQPMSRFYLAPPQGVCARLVRLNRRLESSAGPKLFHAAMHEFT